MVPVLGVVSSVTKWLILRQSLSSSLTLRRLHSPLHTL